MGGRGREHDGELTLYDAAYEHDSCGVAFVADLQGRKSHQTVQNALGALERMAHRGAQGAKDTGDGAGITLQIPHKYLRQAAGEPLPEAGEYATGLVFLPAEAAQAAEATRIIERYVDAEGAKILAWRDVPTNPDGLGVEARESAPRIRQLFLSAAGKAGLALDRTAFAIRKQAERETRERGIAAHFPSLSSRTLVYKGMLTPAQLRSYYPDLSDPAMTSAIALVHSRFSTNTFPSWPLAHPYRYLAHNGEINTIRGNRAWMEAREALLASDQIPGELSRLYPIITPDMSDSCSFDEVLELLHLGGRALPHAVLMMVPEAWEHADLSRERRDFYRFHAGLMEPWDGPACIAFTDGELIGAVLDRNGLRPGRWWRTSDDQVIMASEAGVIDLDPATIVAKGRLQPGKMLLVDTKQNRVVEDDEIKDELANAEPYGKWLAQGRRHLRDLPRRIPLTAKNPDGATLRRQQRTFGYTAEELKLLLAPMARSGGEAVGSMGSDTPIAVLSKRPRLLYDYFTQLFAQVTNPPLDAIREEMVTSLEALLGPEGNLLAPGPDSCRQLVLSRPVLDNSELRAILDDSDPEYTVQPALRVSGLYPVADGAAGIKSRLIEICRHISEAIEDGVQVFVLSDRDATPELAPIPSLLLTAAVHQHLVREQTRTRVELIAEAGDCREVHHTALLLGYGAAAVNPYLALESLPGEPQKAANNYLSALSKGVLKVMSKMGISTISSYTGAQVFEATGLDGEFIARYFRGTSSRIGGVGLDVIAAEVAARHHAAFRGDALLDEGGEYQWRREGEVHLFNPETVFLLQHATKTAQYDVFKKYTQKVDQLTEQSGSLRGLFQLRPAPTGAVPLHEVESADSIIQRFATGAMSYGSISAEAHETLAIAMNSIGGKSNSGEGGEDADRLHDPLRRSAVKQVASGRFGVTSDYLTSADDIQIKMAQGAKPGEGGQLPGNKVWPWIARTRHSTPGVGLISPPPHHDIYSIEDLAQLIFDLRNANPQARVHVKLVSEVGVGTVAAGVAKAHADVVLISGHDGGTGAASLGSVKHAGVPWEIGLAEAQQTLIRNGLRDRITVQVDGALKTGRDVLVAALLGAEEFGFATAPLIVAGCVMMRVCHLDTCPVGIATQNPELRKRYTGKPEFVANFFRYLAEEVREGLAALGLRSLDEAVGRTDLLDTAQAVDHWKAQGLDLRSILSHNSQRRPVQVRGRSHHTPNHLENVLDHTLIAQAQRALNHGEFVRAAHQINNTNRAVGTLLGHEVTRRFGSNGLPDDLIEVELTGTAGQSLGAFLPSGITLRLNGDANDYVGKGLSGGRLILRPDLAAPFLDHADQQIIAGNTLLYGATSGELFARGRVGERFAVRNSGARAVVEGLGDHGCEYMTGGVVVVLGEIGRNFAAGMSGGVAYVYRLDPARVNRELVDLEALDSTDEEALRELLERHWSETDSPLAASLIAGWPSSARRFTKVMPRDYRRVLQIMERATVTGSDVDRAVMGVTSHA